MTPLKHLIATAEFILGLVVLGVFALGMLWLAGARQHYLDSVSPTYEECSTRTDGSVYCGTYDKSTRVLQDEFERSRQCEDNGFQTTCYDEDTVTWTRQVCVGGWRFLVFFNDGTCTWNHPLRKVDQP